jgi:hypothetical protein
VESSLSFSKSNQCFLNTPANTGVFLWTQKEYHIMNISEAIKKYKYSGSASEITQIFNENVNLPVNHDRWTYAGLAQNIGLENVSILDEQLKKTPGFDWVRGLLSGSGIDLADPQTIAGLQLISLPSQITNAINNLIYPTAKNWQIIGLQQEPSEGDVADALNEISNEQQLVYNCKSITICFNRRHDTTDMLSVRVCETTSEGVEGQVISTIASSNINNSEFNQTESILIKSIQSAVDSYLGEL